MNYSPCVLLNFTKLKLLSCMYVLSKTILFVLYSLRFFLEKGKLKTYFFNFFHKLYKIILKKIIEHIFCKSCL